MKSILLRSFLKDARTISPSVYGRFLERQSIFLQNPHHPLLNNHSLHGAWISYRSINITGDYRAIFYIKGDIAFFARIGTHPQLYG